MGEKPPYRLEIEHSNDWVERVSIDGQKVNARGLKLDVMPERYVLWAPLEANDERRAITVLLQSDSTTSRDNQAIAAILELTDAIALLVTQGKAWDVGQLLQLAAGHDAQRVAQVGDRDLRILDSRVRQIAMPEALKMAWEEMKASWDNAASRMPTPSPLGDDDLGLYTGSHRYTGAPEGGLHQHDAEALNAPFRPSRGISSLLRGLAGVWARRDR